MNAYRDETQLALNGQVVVLRPTFAALAEMESASGYELLELARRAATGNLSLQQLTAIVAAGIRGAGGSVPDNLGDGILRTGLIDVLQNVNKWLAAVFAGEAGTEAEDSKDTAGKV